MSDEIKAGIVAGIELGFFAVFCAGPSVVRALLLIFVTVVLLMYIKHDYQDEQRRKRIKRLVEDDRRRLREAESEE